MKFSETDALTRYVSWVAAGDAAVEHVRHAERAVGLHPGRWVLVFAGLRVPDWARSERDGIVTVTRRLWTTEPTNTEPIVRTYVRVYAHDTTTKAPEVLAREAERLPLPSHEVDMNDWVRHINLPYIDMTAQGFNWTPAELEKATRLAMTALHGRTSLEELIRKERLSTK